MHFAARLMSVEVEACQLCAEGKFEAMKFEEIRLISIYATLEVLA